MLAFALAAVLASASAGDPQIPPTATPDLAAQTAAQGDPVDLGDVEVNGRSLDSVIRKFVDEVAAPNRHRGIARWQGPVCIGVANLRAEPAQYIADRVSTVAEDIGLTPGQPGCTPNVIVIASDQPTALAETLVAERRRAFRMGGAGMDRGGDALEAFTTTNRPVRWWQVSMPADAETGARAIRIPGECRNTCRRPEDMAPGTSIFAASRLTTQIVDFLFRTVIILDVNQVSQVSGQQLADYVAMVTFAQINPDADTTGYASILNVFDEPDAAPGLTDWDIAYLQGLYSTERRRQNRAAGRMEIADSIHDAHRALQAGSDD